jgi:hypothetical protein
LPIIYTSATAFPLKSSAMPYGSISAYHAMRLEYDRARIAIGCLVAELQPHLPYLAKFTGVAKRTTFMDKN